jgi:predicted PurR-regulated permease PerM
MAFPDRKTVNVLMTTLLFAAVLGIVYMARAVLITFCFSILFAYLIDPVVSFLDRHSLLRRKARGPHIAEADLGLLILVAGTVYVLIPQASSRPGVFLRNIASFSDRLGSGEIATEMGRRMDGAKRKPSAQKSSSHHTVKPSGRVRARSRVWPQ